MSAYNEAIREHVYNVGRDNRDVAWILSPYDTFHANPFYTGPKVPRPDECEDFDETY